MILVDTSIWVNHLRSGHSTLVRQLEGGRVLGHPCVIGELALGNLSQPRQIIHLLENLPQAAVATHEEVMTLIEREQLSGLGIGYVDVQLLAATRLSAEAVLWTADRRLANVAARLECAIDPEIDTVG